MAYKSVFTSETKGRFVLVRCWHHEVGGEATVRSEPQAVLDELKRRVWNLRDARVLVEEDANPSSWFEIEHTGGTYLQIGPIAADEVEAIMNATGRVTA